MPEEKSKYPEHVKLRAVKEQSQEIGTFLEDFLLRKFSLTTWREAGNNGLPEYIWKEGFFPEDGENPGRLDVCMRRAGINPDYEEWQDGYVPANLSTEKILAEYFEIDLAQIQKEKDAMLEEIRANNKETPCRKSAATTASGKGRKKRRKA